jgi:adenylyltransferase/sulfurtransferase
MVTIIVPTALRNFTGGDAEVKAEGATVGQALNSLATTYPDIRQHLYQGEALRSYINVFLGDTNIKKLDALATALKDGDELMLVPAIAGGGA